MSIVLIMVVFILFATTAVMLYVNLSLVRENELLTTRTYEISKELFESEVEASLLFEKTCDLKIELGYAHISIELLLDELEKSETNV